MPPSGGKNGKVAPATTEDTNPDSRIDIDSGTDTQEKPWLRRFLLEHLNPVNLLPCFKKRYSESGEELPPRTWNQIFSYVADNAKDDPNAPSYFGGRFRGYLAFDTGNNP
ncbi:uncharacterized protein LOC111710800 [Eurytemora carolleeae]|uniref:uncharacterized protein LOC111710800 n=1 Tax=Eurytemora carolleeae TaxID=1294199 RepID=UPI000C787216|nr:uncharacterized protein LOC111710800 [Eurytemora carolleeae]|eukprot:XP_023340711.1 uncharacterized protein LOC111710800 [Eurytemora affinis]